MKKFLTIITLAIFTACMFTACETKKGAMEKELLTHLKVPTSYKCVSFEEGLPVTLATEILESAESALDLMRTYENLLYSQESWLESMKESNRDWAKGFRYSHHTKEELNAQEHKISETKGKIKEYDTKYKHLMGLKKSLDGDVYYQHTLHTYKLTYQAMNGLGLMPVGVCYGRFNKKGELVQIKVDEDEDWKTVGDVSHSPEFYQIVQI